MRREGFQSESTPLRLICIALGLAIVTVWTAARRMEELEERYRVERRRRKELGDEVHEKRLQLDGALETITELKGGQAASPSE